MRGSPRFTKADFYRLLQGFDLANVYQPHTPRWIRVGAHGRLARSDWALMVLLKRMSAAATYKDLRYVLGGSKTMLCDTFLHVLSHVFRLKADRAKSLLPWEDYMLSFTQMMRKKGSPYGMLVGLVDGHLQRCVVCMHETGHSRSDWCINFPNH